MIFLFPRWDMLIPRRVSTINPNWFTGLWESLLDPCESIERMTDEGPPCCFAVIGFCDTIVDKLTLHMFGTSLTNYHFDTSLGDVFLSRKVYRQVFLSLAIKFFKWVEVLREKASEPELGLILHHWKTHRHSWLKPMLRLRGEFCKQDFTVGWWGGSDIELSLRSKVSRANISIK